MRVRLRINQTERELDVVDPNWIAQEINGRRQAGEQVCVRVLIEEGIDLHLATPTCEGGAAGRPRDFDSNEQAVIDLWRERGLHKADFSVGDVISFVQQLRNLLQL